MKQGTAFRTICWKECTRSVLRGSERDARSGIQCDQIDLAIEIGNQTDDAAGIGIRIVHAASAAHIQK